MSGRTIDNLGFDASQRYAENQKLLDGHESLIQDSRMISTKTSIEITQPVFHPQHDLGLALPTKSTSWADFLAPSGFDRPKKLFTHELLPSCGGKEKMEEMQKKIIAISFLQEDDSSPNKEQQWELLQKREKFEKEKESLLALLRCILDLDTCMIYMHAKRSQYHKG